jgi:hypothetical protein
MRRNVLSFFILGLCLVQASVVSAQSERNYRFFVSGDIDFAVSPEVFTDYYSMGFGISAGVEMPVSPAWSFIGLLSYKTFKPDEGTIADWWDDVGEYPGSTNIRVSEGTLTAFTIGVLGKGSLKTETSKVWPYIKGGFGLTIGGADEILVQYDQFGGPQEEWVGGADTGTNFSYQFAIGLEFKLGSGNTSLFVDAGLAMVSVDELDNPSVVPVNVGIKF